MMVKEIGLISLESFIFGNEVTNSGGFGGGSE
jgi:hypothetical protein